VYIDDIQIGKTPIDKKVVEDEKLEITFKKLNYKDRTETIVVKKDLELNPKLEYTDTYKKSLIKTFVISIKSNPTGAQILINNKNAGTTPFENKVKEGVKLQIKLKKKNYEEWVRNITVSDNININKSLDFTQEYKDELAAKANQQREKTAVKDEGGSGSTWWWIGGGVLVAGGAAAILLSSAEKKSEPEPEVSFPMPPSRP